MTYPVFLFAVVALLLAPGPTNTLVALSGTQSGHRSLWFLLPAELLGYLTMILPAAWFGAMIIESLPFATNVLKLTASAWVMYLAISLWRSRSGMSDTEVSAKRVFVTTALNPKALIVAFVLLPPPTDEQFLLKLALFCAAASGVAVVWCSLGRLTRSQVGANVRFAIVQRAASIWLAIVSGSLFFAAFSQ
ncbi:LysE family translocator [Rhizobium skierniewicense]|uniref:LysE family translocator n=1 Tax=Rhizobium skierniewicense TaxID=984260 RepID=UPI00157292E0|nr:LysE family transporter [Rhizobium skierniewicense]NTF35045.1 LysE family transporter [Rhizobium skierniewicense]